MSLLGGYGRHLERVVDHSAYIPEASVTPADLGDAVEAALRYRISLRPGIDLAFEVHRVQTAGTTSIRDPWLGDLSQPHAMRADWWGFGVRRTFGASGIRPFFQGGMVYAREAERRGDSAWESLGGNLGVAFASGGELALGSSLSAPIELGWVHVAPYDELFILGLRSGLTWPPGR